MTGDEREREGWESDSSPDDYRNFSSPGLGAVTHGAGGSGAGAGDYGGGRGTDAAQGPSGEEAEAREGEAQPEFPPVGWDMEGPGRAPVEGPDRRDLE